MTSRTKRRTIDHIMNIVSDSKTYTPSEARDKLYTLIKAASTGLKSFEIAVRGGNSVLIINKAELESWQETLDILSNKREIASIRKARREKKTIPHKKLLKAIGIENES